MHYPDLNPLCLFKLHDNYPETGGLLVSANKKQAGIESMEDGFPSYPDLYFFLVQKGSSLRRIDIQDKAELLDAGDYNGDGSTELVFMAGNKQSGALYLVSSLGELLVTRDWGGYFGP